MSTRGNCIFIMTFTVLFCFFAVTYTSQALSAKSARSLIEIRHSCVTDISPPQATRAQHMSQTRLCGWYPYRHGFYYRRYPYYYYYHRFAYPYRRHRYYRLNRPYYYGYYGHPYYGGYWYLYVPRYYFYPKYNRRSDYYYPGYYSPVTTSGSFPRVAYIIGNRIKPEMPQGKDAQYVVKIVSRLEPRREIEKRLALGKVMLAAGKYDSAAKQFLDAMACPGASATLSASDAEVRLLYARACAAAGRYSAAAFALRRAIALDARMPDVEDAPINRGGEKSLKTSYAALSEMDGTLDALRRHIQANPDDTSAMFVFGFFCAKSGRHGEAKAVLVRLVAMEPDCKEAAMVAESLERGGAVAPKKA